MVSSIRLAKDIVRVAIRARLPSQGLLETRLRRQDPRERADRLHRAGDGEPPGLREGAMPVGYCSFA